MNAYEFTHWLTNTVPLRSAVPTRLPSLPYKVPHPFTEAEPETNPPELVLEQLPLRCAEPDTGIEPCTPLGAVTWKVALRLTQPLIQPLPPCGALQLKKPEPLSQPPALM